MQVRGHKKEGGQLDNRGEQQGTDWTSGLDICTSRGNGSARHKIEFFWVTGLGQWIEGIEAFAFLDWQAVHR